MSNKDELAARIGSNLKRIRTESKLSQKALAESLKLSPTLISRMEKGHVRPSISTLELIAQSMRVEIGYFFRDEEMGLFAISYGEDRKHIQSIRGYDSQQLCEEMQNRFMDPMIEFLKGKQDEDVEFATHGGQEFMYVIEGKVELFLGSKRFIMKQGDAAYWDASIQHKAISVTKKPAKTLNVHLVPGTRNPRFDRAHK